MSNGKHYIWSAVGKFGTELLGFIGNILIARVLSPDDYGLIATLSIITALSMNFTDAGFNDCLIRKRDSDKYDFGTVATYNVVISFLIYLLLFFSAPLIAEFFHREELVGIIKVLSLSIVFKAFTLSGFVQLNKNLKFKQGAIIHLLCSVFSIGIIYSLALCGFGYWSLALQPVVISLLNAILLMAISRWKPYFCFKWPRFKEMFAFSSNLLVSYIVDTVGKNLYSVIIGKFYPISELGYYNQAHKMQTVPTNGINGVVLTTSYPIIAKEKDVNVRHQMYIDLFRKFNFIQSFVVFCLICASDIAFYFLLGEKWIPASPLFKIFMLIGLSYPLTTINQNIIKIQGKSNIYRNLAFLRTGIQLLALILCARMSLKAIVVGQVIASFISASVDMFFCGSKADFPISRQFLLWIKTIWKSLFAFLVAIIPYCYFDDILQCSLFSTILFLMVFVILCTIFKDNTFTYFTNFVLHFFKK